MRTVAGNVTRDRITAAAVRSEVIPDAGWERCAAVIDRLPLPRPFDLELFRVALGRQRGRELHLVPASGTAAGLWIATAAADYLYYPADATPLRQLQVLTLELAHMLLDHEGAPTATNQIARLLLPSLDPAVVVNTLGRVRYTTAQHREAEQFAALLLDRMESAPDASRALAVPGP